MNKMRFNRFAGWLVAGLMIAFSPMLPANEAVRIGDAAGAPMQAVRFAAIQYGLKFKSDFEISINAFSPAGALKALDEGKLDMVFINTAAIPADYRGRQQIYAAEALVFYVSADNPVRKLTTAQLQEIWEGKQPVWSWYGGSNLDVQRLGVKLTDSNSMEQQFFGESRFNKGIFRVHSTGQAMMMLNPASLLAAPYRTDYPVSVEVLSVDGVKPDSRTIADGTYPLSRRYSLLVAAKPARYTDGLIKILHSGAVYRELKNSGLLFLGKIGGEAKK